LEKIMKSLALVVVALGLLVAMATPSLAHPPVYYHHAHGPYYHGGYGVVVVAPAPVYGYATYPPAYPPVYPPVVTPAPAAVVTPVVPGPYYYGVPGVSLGIRGPRVAIGVGL
jgi:hypothetical protein